MEHSDIEDIFGLYEKIRNVTEWCASVFLFESITALVSHADGCDGNRWAR